MAIQVVCPGCHGRFQVSDKFAGQKGPCPKCKTVITIPAKTQEVVVHEPEGFGPKDSAGRAVLKPIERKEARLSMVMVGVIGGVCAAVLLAALVMRVSFKNKETGIIEVPGLVKAVGAVLLAPPLVLAGYTFLRDQELEPYRGSSLWIRTGICSAVYVILWGAYALACTYMLGGRPELFQLLFLVPPLGLAGAVAAFACLDFDLGTGFLHYSLYLLVTVMLLLIMGDAPFAAFS